MVHKSFQIAFLLGNLAIWRASAFAERSLDWGRRLVLISEKFDIGLDRAAAKRCFVVVQKLLDENPAKWKEACWKPAAARVRAAGNAS